MIPLTGCAFCAILCGSFTKCLADLKRLALAKNKEMGRILIGLEGEEIFFSWPSNPIWHRTTRREEVAMTTKFSGMFGFAAILAVTLLGGCPGDDDSCTDGTCTADAGCPSGKFDADGNCLPDIDAAPGQTDASIDATPVLPDAAPDVCEAYWLYDDVSWTCTGNMGDPPFTCTLNVEVSAGECVIRCPTHWSHTPGSFTTLTSTEMSFPAGSGTITCTPTP